MKTPEGENLLSFLQLDITNTNEPVELGINEAFLEDSPNHGTLCAIVTGNCHLCKQPGHFERSCLNNIKKVKGPDNNSGLFQAYYPILAPTIQSRAINTAPPFQSQQELSHPDLY
ncbi:hypothetical protein O181_062728 [Austropuccinia psidii MF-1]|uniref:CCHC-type domain-containing protein n=1 Tax=Austropuccinia psidii MF-1 TaxID=1389203 RepID=A0A9Q3HZU4_9BASI|nr:hypothetical protein [Austropuccinia psidii MF-1]